MQNKQAAKRTNAKIIPFQRDGDFFLRRGTRRLEKNDLFEAAANYRKACSREPQNVECHMALAQVLTEMLRYEESNQILFPMMSRADFPAECYFGMACNFIGLQEFQHARDSLKSYLSLEPEGFYAYDAMDMLSAIEEEDYAAFYPYVLTKEEQQAQWACNQARHLLETGDVKKAVAMLEETAKTYPNDTFVSNNLAMGYFCRHQYREAIDIAKKIIEQEPDNVQAHCNLLLFLHTAGDQDVQQELEYLQNAPTDDPDDLNRIAVILMEMGRYPEALKVLKKLIRFFPYDEGANHRMGVCCYRQGEYQLARECYDRLLKIDPYDTIAAYYRGVCQKAINGEPQKVESVHHYQVPYEEVLRRIRLLNDCIQGGREVLEKQWQEDSSFRGTLVWGLDLPELSAKRALLALIASFEDEAAERVLRRFLLQSTQPDDVKRDVFGWLRRMGAGEPYVAMMNGMLVQSRMGLSCQIPKDLPMPYQRVIAYMLDHMGASCTQATIEYAVKLYERYIISLTGYPRLSKGQVLALAAAFEYMACVKDETQQNTITKGQLCSVYGISLIRLNNALSKIRHQLDGVAPEEEL